VTRGYDNRWPAPPTTLTPIDIVWGGRYDASGTAIQSDLATFGASPSRRLAGQITALTDLGEAAGAALARLHQALGDPDASALPALLAATHHHLPHHPDLAAQVDTVTAHADQIRRQPARRSDTS